jgi:hypothetical protein
VANSVFFPYFLVKLLKKNLQNPLNLLQIIFKFHKKKWCCQKRNTKKPIYNKKPWFMITNLWKPSWKPIVQYYMKIIDLKNHLIRFIFSILKTKMIIRIGNCFLNNRSNFHNWNRWFSRKSENCPTLVLCCLNTHDLYIAKFSKTWTSTHAFNNILAKINYPQIPKGSKRSWAPKHLVQNHNLTYVKNTWFLVRM